jgi:hypothetical protein
MCNYWKALKYVLFGVFYAPPFPGGPGNAAWIKEGLFCSLKLFTHTSNATKQSFYTV